VNETWACQDPVKLGSDRFSRNVNGYLHSEILSLRFCHPDVAGDLGHAKDQLVSRERHSTPSTELANDRRALWIWHTSMGDPNGSSLWAQPLSPDAAESVFSDTK
jgi:hypothetical protein